MKVLVDEKVLKNLTDSIADLLEKMDSLDREAFYCPPHRGIQISVIRDELSKQIGPLRSHFQALQTDLKPDTEHRG